jgi:hypothetical protein
MSDEETTAPPVDETSPDPVEDATLGPEGVKALEAFKVRAREAEKKAKRVDELEAQLSKFQQDAMSEQEKALAQARTEAADQARSEVMSTVNERLFAAEVRASSAGRLIDDDLLSDPVVAQRLLDLDGPPLTDSGDIDSAAIADAVSRLLESKPHLAVSATRTPGSADQGARPGGSRPAQLTQADLETMKPHQIVTAGEEGRLNDLLGRR